MKKSPFEGGQGDVKNMKMNRIIPYNPKLKLLARKLRNNSTKAEIILWNKIKKKSLGFEFHRQVPIDEYIVDFFCHELMLAIEIDGSTHHYNYEKDNVRQKKLENFGIKVIRFDDKDVRFALNDILRSVELTIENCIIEMKEHPPAPFKGGEQSQY
jgi:very-short-patch-repair endonuclease